MELLPEFISYLEKHNLVEFDILRTDEDGFQNRFRLQKYVFLAQRFGLGFSYRHTIYLYGPYSRTLAEDYYALAENKTEKYDGVLSKLPESFRGADFLRLVRGKSADWLEIATTLIARREFITERKALLESVADTKPGFDADFIESVLDDLQNVTILDRLDPISF